MRWHAASLHDDRLLSNRNLGTRRRVGYTGTQTYVRQNEVADDWSVADLEQIEIIRTLEGAIRRGRADDPGVRDPAEVLRGLGLMRDGQLLRAATVLFGRAERIEPRMSQCLLRVARF